MSSTSGLAKKIHALHHIEIADKSRQVARQCLLDWFGCSLAGAHEPVTDIVAGELAHSNAGMCRLVGRTETANMVDAALINGTAGHALDYDDNSTMMMGHPSVSVMPVVIALAEELGSGGEDILRAIIAGHETEAMMGRYTGVQHYSGGFHATGTIGTFGAAAAASYLLDFSVDEIARTLSLAATQSAGLKAMFGTMGKPFHAGKAAANGLLAARLVKRGFDSRTDGLEAKQGFKHVFGGGEETVAIKLDGFGEQIQNTTFKYHAACYGTHSAIEAMLDYKRDHDSDDIQSIDVYVPKMVLDMANIADPQQGLEAKFSLRQTIAMAAMGVDTAGLENFSDAMVKDQALITMRQKITVYGEDGHGLDGLYARLVFTSADGAVEIEKNISTPLEDKNAQEEKLKAKFKSMAGAFLDAPRADNLCDKIMNIESLAHIHEIMDIAATA